MPKVNCPACQATLTIPEASAMDIRCPKCSKAFRLNGAAPARAMTAEEHLPAAALGRSKDQAAEEPRRAAQEEDVEEDPDEPRRRRHAASEEDDEQPDVARRLPKGRRKYQPVPLLKQPAFLIGAAVMALIVLSGLGVGGYFLFRSEEPAPSSSKEKEKEKDKPLEKDTTPYEIKIRKESKGDKGRIVKIRNQWIRPERSNYNYVEEILEKEGDNPATQIRRNYEKAEINLNGIKTLPFQKRTVLIQKMGPQTIYTFEGGNQLTANEAKELAEEFDKPESDMVNLFLPGQKVVVGEEWTVDCGRIVNEINRPIQPFHVNESKCSIKGKLVSVPRKKDQSVGVIEIRAEFGISSVDRPRGPMKLKDGSKISMHFYRELCIDGTSRNYSGRDTVNGSMVLLQKGADGKESEIPTGIQGSAANSYETLDH